MRSPLPFLALTLGVVALCAAEPKAGHSEKPLTHKVKFEVGQTQFENGDRITVQNVRGSGDKIAPGETFSIDGTYTLASRDEALLAVYITSNSTNHEPFDPRQHLRVTKGTGSFHLVKTIYEEEGYLHVSFYPYPSGQSFGGTYFGQGKGVLLPKGKR